MEQKKTNPKITFNIPENEWVNLKMMCMLTHSTMTNFIRNSVKEKIKDLREKNNEISKNFK